MPFFFDLVQSSISRSDKRPVQFLWNQGSADSWNCKPMKWWDEILNTPRFYLFIGSMDHVGSSIHGSNNLEKNPNIIKICILHHSQCVFRKGCLTVLPNKLLNKVLHGAPKQMLYICINFLIFYTAKTIRAEWKTSLHEEEIHTATM